MKSKVIKAVIAIISGCLLLSITYFSIYPNYLQKGYFTIDENNYYFYNDGIEHTEEILCKAPQKQYKLILYENEYIVISIDQVNFMSYKENIRSDLKDHKYIKIITYSIDHKLIKLPLSISGKEEIISDILVNGKAYVYEKQKSWYIYGYYRRNKISYWCPICRIGYEMFYLINDYKPFFEWKY